MKTRFFIFILAIGSIFFLNSCEEGLLDFSDTFDYEYEVTVLTTGDTSFSETAVVDLAEQSDLIAQYGDKIKSIEIQEVKYWLTSFTGDDDQKIIEASLKVANEDGTDQKTITTIQDQDLKPLLNSETDLEVIQEGVDKMAGLIKEPPHKLQLAYNTACNKGPLNFTVRFKFSIKMVANPL